MSDPVRELMNQNANADFLPLDAILDDYYFDDYGGNYIIMLKDDICLMVNKVEHGWKWLVANDCSDEETARDWFERGRYIKTTNSLPTDINEFAQLVRDELYKNRW